MSSLEHGTLPRQLVGTLISEIMRRVGLIVASVGSFPHTGQNLWFTYDSAKDVDLLLQNLHPLGIRESALVCKLNETFPDTSKAIFQPKRQVPDIFGDGYICVVWFVLKTCKETMFGDKKKVSWFSQGGE